VSPSPRAALVAGLLAVAAFSLPVPAGVWLVALAGLLGAALADAWLVRVPPWAVRSVPTSIVRGTRYSLTVELRVAARDAAPAGEPAPAGRFRVRQPVPPEMRAEPSEAPDRLDSTLVASVRGRYVLPPVAVRATGPLGLARRDFRVGEPLEVGVYPDLPGARHLAAARRRTPARRDEGQVRAMLGLGTEFESVRDYAPDDDVRRINWAATARVGRPMTNQYRVERDREVLFLLDSGRLMAAPVGDATRLDIALDVLAAVAVAAEEAGDRVGALVFADEVRRELAPRRKGAESLVLALAALEASPADSDYARAFQRAADRKRAIVVVLTDLLDDSASRHLSDALPVLARRHPLVVVSARDPDIEAVLKRVPSREVEVLEMAAALDVLAGRDRIVARARAHGALVVDRTPDSLASACVAAYLAVKRRARL
jgi:uncharacterized protein (DUF58 family)